MMRTRIEAWLLKQLADRMARHANMVELIPKYSLGKSVALDRCEIEEIEKIWKPISSKIDLRYWMVYKGMFPFSALLTPDDIYVRSMVRVLNPMRKCYCMQNKNMYPILYKDIRMPATWVNCIDGVCYDSSNCLLPKSHIYSWIIKNSDNPRVILKPSADTCSGNGVEILNLHDELACNAIIQKAGDNFVIQELLSQSEATKRFNPSSLNTFRVNTLNINGLITVENIMFRHGRGDSPVDNAGAGGICVGFDPDGKVVGKAIDAKLNEYDKTIFGDSYKSVNIPELKSICAVAMAAHQEYLPMMCHAAWDFALDSENTPVLIEVNLGWPGVMTEQLSSCRPIFGNRTEEIIEYAVSHKSLMSFSDFMGHWT